MEREKERKRKWRRKDNEIVKDKHSEKENIEKNNE